MNILNSDVQYLRNLADSGFGNEDQCERYLEIADNLEELISATICPIGIISVETFDNGMEVIKQAYADLMEERNALLAVVPALEEIANYRYGGDTPPALRLIAIEALDALPKQLKES